MSIQSFYFVTLTHSKWEDALAFAKRLPPEATAELRLDLFPNNDPKEMVTALNRKCLVSCRRIEDGGNWHKTERERLAHLISGIDGRPSWVDLEWDLEIPAIFDRYASHVNLLRSVHVKDEIFDLEWRLGNLPNGDAFKWVGKATRLTDNLKIKKTLGIAKDMGLNISAFMTGPKGILSRCMQAAWGGSFTYAHPDNAPPVISGQISLGNMMSWHCHHLSSNCKLYGVIGHPITHSLGPNYHNQRFQKLHKNILYLPLDCCDAEEAKNAIESIGLLGVSVTTPLKSLLPIKLGLRGPVNTLWRESPGKPWKGTNTDYVALNTVLNSLPAGPVLILGDGSVARITQKAILHRGWPYLVQSRKKPVSLNLIRNLKPIGIIQATSLGMHKNDPIPFADALTATMSSIQWGIEWIYKENTAFAKWIVKNGCNLISGIKLFELQATKQSDIFLDIVSNDIIN